MSGQLIFCIVIAVAFAALGLADQRKLWWRLNARWYSNPEANEPSDAALMWKRVMLFIFAAMILFAGCKVQESEEEISRIEREIERSSAQLTPVIEVTPTGDPVLTA